MQFKTVIFSIFLLFILKASFAQHHYCKNININDGLPDNSVNDLHHDQRGFLWIGTNTGLARFDGKNFKIYTSADGLDGDNIKSIAEEKNGKIWISCFPEGLNSFDGQQFISYSEHEAVKSKHFNKLHFSEQLHTLFMGTENDIIVYDGNDFKSILKKTYPATENFTVRNFIETPEDIYIFTTSDFIFRYSKNLQELIQTGSINEISKYRPKTGFISSRGDTLLQINQTGLIHKNKGAENSFSELGPISDFCEDSNQTIWIASSGNDLNGSSKLYQLKNNKLQEYSYYIGLNTNNISTLEFYPEENILWIATSDKGIYMYPMDNFTYYKAQDFSIGELNICDIQTDNFNNLIICTQKDLLVIENKQIKQKIRFDQFKNTFETFKRHKIKNKYSYLNDPGGSYDKYQYLMQSGKYNYSNPYLVYKNGILTKLNDGSLYKPNKYDIIVNKQFTKLNTILTDMEGNIWVGCNTGIFKIPKNSEDIKYYDLEGSNFSSFLFNANGELYANCWDILFVYPEIEKSYHFSVFNSYQDKSPININKAKMHNGKLYFTSRDYGLFIFDNNRFYSSYYNKSKVSNSIVDFCFDLKGNIILGSTNGNIYIASYTNDSLNIVGTINKDKGINGQVIRFLTCTNNNLLLIGTNTGLNCIDLNKYHASGTLTNIFLDKYSGFTDLSGNIGFVLNNKLLIGTTSQFIRFNLDALKNTLQNASKLYVKKIEINEEEINLNSIKTLNPWTNIPSSDFKLPFYKNSIIFYFDIIKYIRSDKTFISYKLESHANVLKSKILDGKIVFQNLKPGNYRLRINSDSNSTATGQEFFIPFSVGKPLWLKWWFLAMLFVSISALIWFMINQYSKYIKKQEQKRIDIAEKITEFELKALRAQMNPHFIFNAINSIQNYMLDNDVDMALNYLSDFAKLIRLTLDNVSKKEIPIEHELNYLKYYINLEQMRFDKNIETEIILPPDYDYNKVLIPPMILQPFIENAIKHGFIHKKTGGLIKLHFEITTDNILKCIIEDNGIGRKKSKELNKNTKTHQSKGIFITNERFALLNQTRQRKGYQINTIDLYDNNKQACGTRVEIFIPL